MKIDKLLLAVTGDPTDKEVLLLGTTLARRFGATIYAIYVIEVKRSLPINAEVASEIEKGEGLLDSVEQLCEDEQIPVETALLQAREIGPAIVDEAAEREVDAIILGVSHRKRPDEGELGPTALYVLKNALCRVWLTRPALPPDGSSSGSIEASRRW